MATSLAVASHINRGSHDLGVLDRHAPPTLHFEIMYKFFRQDCSLITQALAGWKLTNSNKFWSIPFRVISSQRISRQSWASNSKGDSGDENVRRPTSPVSLHVLAEDHFLSHEQSKHLSILHRLHHHQTISRLLTEKTRLKYYVAMYP